MIEISQLRLENYGQWIRLVADITSDVVRTDKESTIWIGVKNENASMLTTDVYNAFLFLPMYMSMYYHTDLCIHGEVSKILYRNMIDYIQPILCSFSDKLSPVNVIVDGFKETKTEQKIVGTGISCGVDCLATIYKYYEKENNPEYKLNALFMLNCGWHGNYYDKSTFELFEKRCKVNGKAAADIGLPLFMVDSNLHAFLPQLDDQSSYFSIYTCIFAMEKAISRYYISSSFSYGEVMKYGMKARNRDFSEYADPSALPLMHSANLKLVSDGCQYTRSQKTELISDWNISKKYLNVCCINDSEENCCTCIKCVRTLLPLEAMGKIDAYKAVFDLDKWKKISYAQKCRLTINNGRDAFSIDNYKFCKEHGMKLPSLFAARMYFMPSYIRKPQIILNRLFKKH
ncbi:MAG: hypothetical protein HFJ03_12545 [Lachnospira sp.]|nr:hypothetical protein [Lachnospira sp.]